MRTLLSNVDITLTSETIVAEIFPKKDVKAQNDSYPDVFKQFFKKLAHYHEENGDCIQLLLIVSSKAVNEKKLEQLRTLLCDPNDAKKKPREAKIRKERFKEIFEKLFKICSVQILEEIENSGYVMERSETYRD